MMLRLELRFKGTVLGEPPGFTPLAVLHPRAFAPVGQDPQDRRGFAVRGLRSRQSSVKIVQVCNGSWLCENAKTIDGTMFQMCGVFAEFERSMIVERVNAGLARAKADTQVVIIARLVVEVLL